MIVLRDPPKPSANIPNYIRELYRWLTELAQAVRQLQKEDNNGSKH